MQTNISPMPNEFTAKTASSKNTSPAETPGETKQSVAAEFSQVMRTLAAGPAEAFGGRLVDREAPDAPRHRHDASNGDMSGHAESGPQAREEPPAPETADDPKSGISLMMVGRGVAVAHWEVSYGKGDSAIEPQGEDKGLVFRLSLGKETLPSARETRSDKLSAGQRSEVPPGRAGMPTEVGDTPAMPEPLAGPAPQLADEPGKLATPVAARPRSPDAGPASLETSMPEAASANAAAISTSAGEETGVDDPADRPARERQAARYGPQLPELANERAFESVVKRTDDIGPASISDRPPARARSQTANARGNAEMAAIPPLPAKAEARIELVSLQTHLQPASVSQPMAQALGNVIGDGLQEVLVAPVSAELPDEAHAKGVSRHMEIELHPRELGVVRVVMVSRGGEVFIEIVPTTDKARELLSAQRDVLAQAIRQAGSPQVEISIRLSVETVAGRDFQAGQNPNWSGSQGGSADAWSDSNRHRASPEYRDDRSRQAPAGQPEGAETKPARAGLYL